LYFHDINKVFDLVHKSILPYQLAAFEANGIGPSSAHAMNSLESLFQAGIRSWGMTTSVFEHTNLNVEKDIGDWNISRV
jgi:hypothetical protein